MYSVVKISKLQRHIYRLAVPDIAIPQNSLVTAQME